MRHSGDLEPLDDYLIDFWRAARDHWLTTPDFGGFHVVSSQDCWVLHARISCLDGIRIDVRIVLLLVRSKPMLCMVEDYAFHCRRGDVPLFRYDSAPHHHEHPTPHHKHLFDATGKKIDPPQHVGAVPSLAEVLDELAAVSKADQTTEGSHTP